MYSRDINSVFYSATAMVLITALQLVACVGEGDDGENGGESITAETLDSGSVSLEWTAPVMRADGTPLSLADIGGYHIYFGESEDDYPNLVDLNDGTAQAVTLTDIPVGSYYMVMTTYDVDGRESGYSTPVKKTVY